MTSSGSGYNIPFLKGGGEMGALIRGFDWQNHSLGSPERWPQSLRTALSIVLNSKFPMFLWWGPELTCFYNDAYRPSLGNNGKHPSILGQRAEDAWPEIWDIIKPLIDRVLSGEEATWSEDQLIPIYRNGKIEDAYWTFSYSPISDESGNVAGVLVTCCETTDKVRTLNKLSASEQRFRNLVNSAVVATAVLSGRDMKLDLANEAALRIWGSDNSILGISHLEFLPDAQRQSYLNLLRNVYDTGEVYSQEESPVQFVRDGRQEEFFFDFTYKPLYDDLHQIIGIFATGIDVTEKVLARKKVEESERNLRLMIMQVPISIAIFRGPKYVTEIANDRALQLWGRKLGEVQNKPILDVMYELRDQGIGVLLDDVYKTGEPFYATELPVKIMRNGALEESFINFGYEALFDADGSINGIIAIGIEVTDQVLARRRLEKSEQSLRTLVENAPFPIGVYIGREMRIELANQVILDIWGKGNNVVGKLYSEILPELDSQEVFQQLAQVYTTGLPFHAKNKHINLVVDGKIKPFYFNYSFTPLFNSAGEVYGVMNTAADVTDLNVAKLKIEESEKRFRNVADTAPVLIWMSGTDKLRYYFSKAWLNFTSRNVEQEMGDGWTAGVHPEDLQRYHDVFNHAFDERQVFYLEYRLKRHDGEYRWISENGVPRFTTNGTFEGYIGACMDIHDDVTSRKKIKETIDELSKTTKRLQLALEAGKLGSFELDVTTGIMECTLQCKRDFGLEKGDTLTYNSFLQTILPDDLQLFQHLIDASLKNNIPYELEFRMRWPDESVHWIYAAGIPFYNEDGNTLQIISVTTEITEQKLFEQALEIQVLERTRELEQKNVELEKMNGELNSFAYVSSHDLQEPLRKIQTFSDRIIEQDYEGLSERGKDYFRRMQAAAKRMQALIEDLLAYSRTNNTDKVFEKTDLNQIVKDIRDDFKEQLQSRHATVIIESELCELNVIPFQFRQLIQNLISNALKFSSPQRRSIISIKSKIEVGNKLRSNRLDPNKKYCHFSVSDNGIGFEPEYNEKIFEVFQRLHSAREYEGTGIGLAIVKKIVENHNGVITASGELDKGATFDVYIPV